MKQKLIEVGSKTFDNDVDGFKTVYTSNYIDELLADGWRIVTIVREADYNTLILFEHE